MDNGALNSRIPEELRAYSLTDVEAALGVTHRTLQTWVTEGHVKAVKIGGRWRVPETELRRILTEGTGRTGDKRKKPRGNKKKPKGQDGQSRKESH